MRLKLYGIQIHWTKTGFLLKQLLQQQHLLIPNDLIMNRLYLLVKSSHYRVIIAFNNAFNRNSYLSWPEMHFIEIAIYHGQNLCTWQLNEHFFPVYFIFPTSIGFITWKTKSCGAIDIGTGFNTTTNRKWHNDVPEVNQSGELFISNTRMCWVRWKRFWASHYRGLSKSSSNLITFFCLLFCHFFYLFLTWV